MTDQPDWTKPGSRSEDPAAQPPSQPYGSSDQTGGYGQPPADPYGSTGQSGYGQPAWEPVSPGSSAPGSGASGSSESPSGWGGAEPGPAAATKPGVIALRPLGVGEILDGAISTMRAYPGPMIGLSAAVAVVTQLVTLFLLWLFLRDAEVNDFTLEPGENPFDLLGGVFAAAAVSGLLGGIAVLFLIGMLTVVVSRAVLGQPVSIETAWKQAAPRLPALIATTLLIIVILFAIVIVPFVLGVLTGSAPLTVLFMLAAFVGVIYFGVSVALAPVAVVLEGQSPVAAIKRSRDLIKGAWWRTFGILILVVIISAIMGAILQIPFGLVAAGLGDENKIFEFGPALIEGLGTVLSSAITWPFTAAATVLLYVDRRIRREGLDLELARAAQLPPTDDIGWSGPSAPDTGSSYGG